MKRILTLILALTMLTGACFAFTACGGSDKDEYIGTYTLTSLEVASESKDHPYAATFNAETLDLLEIGLKIKEDELTLTYTMYGTEKSNSLGTEWEVDGNKITVGDYLEITADGDTLSFEHSWYLAAGFDPIKTAMTFTKSK